MLVEAALRRKLTPGEPVVVELGQQAGIQELVVVKVVTELDL
jgi:hypothetical protein